MKPYLITTGTIFSLMTLVHIWRAIAEWPSAHINFGFVVGLSALILLPGALAAWAWCLLQKTSNNQANPGGEKTGV